MPLLSLPREIRSQIVAEVLCLPVQEPPKLDDLDDEIASRRELPGKTIRAWTHGRHLYFPVSDPPINPIFLLCRQVNAEARETLSHLPAHYVLDVVLHNEVNLVPTWTVMAHFRHSVPRFVNSIVCNFRIAGTFDSSGGRDYTGFRIGDGAGPAMGWVLYSLLERFFHYGPFWTGNEERIDIVCHEVVINVRPPTHVPADWLIQLPLSSSLRGAAAPKFVTQPKNPEGVKPTLSAEYLRSYIAREIGGLLLMEYYRAEYGDFLYTHLDRVEVSMGGEASQIFEILSKLQKLDPQYATGTWSKAARREAFLTWRPRAMALRKRRGLEWAEIPGWDGSDLGYQSYSECLNDAFARERGRIGG